MTTHGRELIESLSEALEHACGTKTGVRERLIEIPDVRSIRENLHMSQAQFALAYRIPLATLKGWEQGRQRPDATAVAFLSVIARLPVETRAALLP